MNNPEQHPLWPAFERWRRTSIWTDTNCPIQLALRFDAFLAGAAAGAAPLREALSELMDVLIEEVGDIPSLTSRCERAWAAARQALANSAQSEP